mmetsp:Transcript_28394/g.43727  ORF Transcript_28394/g.43727 Transcript_28394/m.43727 type:complete len:83 (+) Transcript_28394:723-971(+)
MVTRGSIVARTNGKTMSREIRKSPEPSLEDYGLESVGRCYDISLVQYHWQSLGKDVENHSRKDRQWNQESLSQLATPIGARR